MNRRHFQKESQTDSNLILYEMDGRLYINEMNVGIKYSEIKKTLSNVLVIGQ